LKKIIASVSNDETGFSSAILKKGAAPFCVIPINQQRRILVCGDINHLSCKKHGSNLTLQSYSNGAKATVKFYFETLRDL